MSDASSDGTTVGATDGVDVEVLAGGVGNARAVEAGEPAFVAMWEQMGGQERYDRRARWLSTTRARFVDALLADLA